MASLLQIRDAVALHGIVDSQQLSRQFNTSPALVQAILEQLEKMHKIERIELDSGCLTGSCKGCPEGEKCLTTTSYRLKA